MTSEKSLLKSGSLTMAFEKENTRDSYGRLLVYVYVGRKSVQETLLIEGFARVGYIMNSPYKYLAFIGTIRVWKEGTI
jgi:micrococcal nuclease